jgi:hypothetical protein
MTVLGVLSFSHKAFAYNNAKEVYDAAGGSRIIYQDGWIYYAARGVKADSGASRTYRSIGIQAKVRKKDGQWSSNYMAKLGYNGFDRLPDYVDGTYSYTAFRTSLSNLISKIPDAADEIGDRNYNLNFQFNFIVTTTTYSNGYRNQDGDIHENGAHAWGSVAYNESDAEAIIKNAFGYWVEMETYYNIPLTVWGNQKPTARSDPGMFDYFDGSNNWYQFNGAVNPYIPYAGSTDRWYKRGATIQLDNVSESYNSNLMHVYFMLYNAANGGRDMRYYVKLNSPWNATAGMDATDGAYRNVSLRMHDDNGNSSSLRRFQMTFNVVDDRDMLYYGNAINNYYVWAVPDNTWGVAANRRIRIDGLGPAGTVSLDSGSTANNKVVKVTNLADRRNYQPAIQADGAVSGVNKNTVRADIKKKGTSTFLAYGQQMTEQWDGSFKLNVAVNSGYMYNQFGTYTADIYASDNVGNDCYIGSVDFDTIDPTPDQAVTDLQNWHYAEPNTNFRWVNTTDQFRLVTYANSKIGAPSPSVLNTTLETSGVENEFKSVLGGSVSRVSGNDFYLGSGCSIVSTSPAPNIQRSTTIIYTKATNSAEGKVFNVWGQAYTIIGTTYYTGGSAGEKDGEKLCVDGSASPPTLSLKTRTSINISAVDNLSGIGKMELYEGSSTTNPVWSHTESTTNSTVRSKTYTVNVTSGKSYRAKITDNVGNISWSSTIKIPIQYASIVTNEVTRNNRKQLEVIANGSVANTDVPTQSRFVFNSSGVSIPGPDIQVSVIQSPALNYRGYIDDKSNTSSSPVISYSENNISAKFNWTKLEDIILPYTFNIQSSLFTGDPLTVAETSGTTFASGYKDNRMQIWSVSGNNVQPNGTPLIDKRLSGLEHDFSNYPTGWYCIKVTMYDYNDNPSGTGTRWIYHTMPALLTPSSIEVTAVKDVKWQKAVYPFRYGLTGKGDGVDASKFPLGKAYKFDGRSISQGYAINYNITKEGSNNVDSVELVYKTTGSSGQPLTIYVDRKIVGDLDTLTGTNYYSQKIVKENLPEGTPIYLKHFLPVNFVAKDSTGKEYKGDVNITLQVTSNVGTNRNTFEVPLYTIDMSNTALDDMESDKQR